VAGPDDPTTGELRAIQADREKDERSRAETAEEEAAARAAERRADKAAYLRRKLEDQEEALGE
jgi:hypothetical protein